MSALVFGLIIFGIPVVLWVVGFILDKTNPKNHTDDNSTGETIKPSSEWTEEEIIERIKIGG